MRKSILSNPEMDLSSSMKGPVSRRCWRSSNLAAVQADEKRVKVYFNPPRGLAGDIYSIVGIRLPRKRYDYWPATKQFGPTRRALSVGVRRAFSSRRFQRAHATTFKIFIILDQKGKICKRGLCFACVLLQCMRRVVHAVSCVVFCASVDMSEVQQAKSSDNALKENASVTQALENLSNKLHFGNRIP
ncbi:hypothetical protein VTP01DRAFT_9603 [Rhizomucor pusillus]|uniref:uncharacterized protein n=1 Tax=Rhizomucor pusillus TaxID=4840 RepID=UPI0037439ECD